eukprot:5959169-Prymnesium_polylepis.1
MAASWPGAAAAIAHGCDGGPYACAAVISDVCAAVACTRERMSAKQSPPRTYACAAREDEEPIAPTGQVCQPRGSRDDADDD